MSTADSSSGNNSKPPDVPSRVFGLNEEQRMPSSPDGRLSVASLEGALTSLNGFLRMGDTRLTIALLGGAALALVHRARNSTHDVMCGRITNVF